MAVPGEVQLLQGVSAPISGVGREDEPSVVPKGGVGHYRGNGGASGVAFGLCRRFCHLRRRYLRPGGRRACCIADLPALTPASRQAKEGAEQ